MNPFDELIKCRNDFLYFVDTYIKIQHPKLGLIPLKVYDYQKSLKKEYDENLYVILTKFRQGGFTTYTAIWALWEAMFHTERTIFFGSKSDREAVHIGKIISRAIENLPDWLKPNLKKDNEHEKIFVLTNSQICFYALEAARSKSMTHLIIDEAAFIQNMEEKWKCMYPCLSNGGRVFILSTPNGVGNWFQGIYQEALEGKNNFKAVQFHYWEHPDYKDPIWVKNMKEKLGDRGFRQEVLGEFLIDNIDLECHTADKIASDLIYFMTAKELSEEDMKLLYTAVKKLRTIKD